MNYAEKRLQVFASASSGEQKKQRQDGPVIICLDTSSSMNGEPARIARMLAIAVSIYAMRRRRKVMVIKYSNTHKIETFTKRRVDRSRLMKFLQWTGVGGNSENSMFEDLLRLFYLRNQSSMRLISSAFLISDGRHSIQRSRN